ncbi:hypothetical protein [Paenibacillus sacheonensis]|uniref:Uncharacterized protein n=1 Tax=Paenibacillus sacheonensis TaxID=742054 RepID=A0A7X5C216_9BACL|nr:hypothetical protein [Paenibacillus sacheonensis]MBM7565262.1 chromosome segregation ATPase [Paenibacillus sacheonensis]NBC69964.1 hypothetical protein [Paenibacillus sacheonensis]
MAILNMKKKTFAELESKTINKIRLFNDKKSDATAAVSEFISRLREIHEQIRAKEVEYTQSMDNKMLREIDELTSKKAQVERLINIQRQAFSNGDSKLELTDADREDLASTFAPYRKQERELTEKLIKQYADLEKTLDELKNARDEYWEQFYAPFNGQVMQATGDIFAVHFLRRNDKLGEASYKLQNLANHKAFPQSYVD